MAVAEDKKTSIKGGEFLIKETLASQIFIPEEFNEEQQMIADTCRLSAYRNLAASGRDRSGEKSRVDVVVDG